MTVSIFEKSKSGVGYAGISRNYNVATPAAFTVVLSLTKHFSCIANTNWPCVKRCKVTLVGYAFQVGYAFSSRFGNAFCYQQHVRFYGHLGCNVILKNNRHTASVQGSVRPAAARVGAGERSCAEGRERGRVDTNVLGLQLATINYFTFKKCNNLKWIGFHK